jgi:hypothetical protein
MRPPRKGRVAGVYRRILDAAGDRVDDIGGHHQITAHWPFVGSRYRGLIIAGQALDGWDAAVTPARWALEEARNPVERDRLLGGTQDWANARDEPIAEVLRWGHRRRAPFWGFARRVVPLLEPDAGGDWYSRYAWWNVYPLGWGRGSPTGPLKAVQRPHVGELFWAVADELKARRVVLVAGKDWWWEVRELLGLRDLQPGTKPIIAAGRVRGVTVVATYHPSARLPGTTRDDFASAVAGTVRSIERD